MPTTSWRWPLLAVCLLAPGLTLGCLSARPTHPGPSAGERAPIAAMLEDLYATFCFDADDQADWEGMRAHFADGASFVAPIPAGGVPKAVDAQQFIADFQNWIATSEVGNTGLHERIVHLRIDVFGSVAHAFVTFEGFVPPDPSATTRGLDSIQLVKSGTRWLLASFSTQYESEGSKLPQRFLR